MTDQRIDPRALTDAQLLQRFNLGSLSEEVDADTLGRIREWAGECSEADDADAAAADPSSAALKQAREALELATGCDFEGSALHTATRAALAAIDALEQS